MTSGGGCFQQASSESDESTVALWRPHLAALVHIFYMLIKTEFHTLEVVGRGSENSASSGSDFQLDNLTG